MRGRYPGPLDDGSNESRIGALSKNGTSQPRRPLVLYKASSTPQATTQDTQTISSTAPLEATVIPRASHSISRADISEGALKVLYRLKGAGFAAYMVGGGVRDLLLGREPKDFDIATNARPEEVKELFRNSRLIGRRFRLAHVRYGRDIIEVATFRSSGDDGEDGERVMADDGRIVRDNAYGTLEDDAVRRDFTINGLYYNIADFSVVDFADGVADLEAGLLRLIGDPEVRFREDPVRILRALRFSAKLGFRLEAATEAPIRELAVLLEDIAPARLFDEVLKLFFSGHGVASFELMDRYGVFERMFPQVHAAMQADAGNTVRGLLLHSLANTDTRIAEDRPVTPAFLFAAFLWGPLLMSAQRLAAGHEGSDTEILEQAASEVIEKQNKLVGFPKRFTLVSREIWSLQARLEQRRGRRPMQLLGHPRFRAAYDFLLLRAEAGEALDDLPEWWTNFQEENEDARRAMLAELGPQETRKPRRRRRRRRAAAS